MENLRPISKEGDYMTTKETKELLIALIGLTKLLKNHLEDGISIDDAAIIYELVNNPEYKEAVLGINLIIEELKNISLREGIDLIQTILNELK